MDASVLIDFLDTDSSVLKLISDNVGTIHVASPMLREEIEPLADTSWDQLGLFEVEPSLEVASAAAARRAGLSFYDHLCLLMARESRWTCVTNDGLLRRECGAEKVPVLWGLETVAVLVEVGAMPAKSAAELGHAIQRINPRFITEKVLRAFLARVEATATRKGRRR